ncbi:MAG TPA: YdcF family protein [Acidimicrobiales bacterium]|nr:YdcF family protein [Acidimicrobiales bacterium]
MRLLVKVVLAVVAVVILYLGVTFVQVWMASRRDDARAAQAIVVLGAAQYNGRPSSVLRARLDHAADLWRRKLAPVIVVTGGRQTGDKFTEATASANYLISKGVPDEDLLREVSGQSSWQSLAATATFLGDRKITQVLLVSDPFHSYRIRAIADELGLDGRPSPTRTSPIGGITEVRYLLRETAAVALGRVIGFRREAGVHGVVNRGSAPTSGYAGVAHSGVV